MGNVFKTSLGKFENFILGSMFLVMLVAMVTQVVNRTFIHAAMPWLEELAVYAMIYLVFIGTEAGLRDGSQLSVTLVPERLSGRARLAVEALTKLVVLGFSAVLMMASYNLVTQQVSSGQLTPALRWPMWIPYGAFLLAFILIVIVQTVTLVMYVRALIAGDDSLVREVAARPEDIDNIVEKERAALADNNDDTQDGAR